MKALPNLPIEPRRNYIGLHMKLHAISPIQMVKVSLEGLRTFLPLDLMGKQN